ncbi:hypothetical protein VPH35_028625 [Triticum aestivum]
MLEVAAVIAMDGSPPASGVVISRRAPPSLLLSHSGYGLPLPLGPVLLLLRFRFQAVAEGRLSISILPIWSTSGEPGCFLSTCVLTSPEWVILFAFWPLGPLPMIHYIITTTNRIRCTEPELSGHLQHTVLVARCWHRRRRGHGKSDEVSGCVLCLIFDATSSWRGGRKAGQPAAVFCSGRRAYGDAGAGEHETSHPQRRFK